MNSQLLLYISAAYILGSVPFGKIIAAKVARIDITTRGSKNIGATNVAREVGLKWGVLTLTVDLLKGFLPILLYRSLATLNFQELCLDLSLIGLASLLGHQFSLFLGFRGGKGVATALGVYLGISPLGAAFAVLCFISAVYIWDIISLASLISACAMPFILAATGVPFKALIVPAAISFLICLRHRDNLVRIVQGKERRWRSGKDQHRSSSNLSSSSSE